MRNSTLALSLLCCATAAMVQSGPVRLSTRDTIILLEAGPQAPRLVRLGDGWLNRAPEALAAGPWRFDPAASSTYAQRVQFVYECANPPLRPPGSDRFGQGRVRASTPFASKTAGRVKYGCRSRRAGEVEHRFHPVPREPGIRVLRNSQAPLTFPGTLSTVRALGPVKVLSNSSRWRKSPL